MRKASILVTKDRIFYEDRITPPRILYYLGLFDRRLISETLRNQIHSTYTQRQVSQIDAWRLFRRHMFRFIIWGSIFGILIGVIFVDVILLSILVLALFTLSALASIFMAWHASNAFVELARAWPRRIYRFKGIGIDINVPYLLESNVSDIGGAIWGGKSAKKN